MLTRLKSFFKPKEDTIYNKLKRFRNKSTMDVIYPKKITHILSVFNNFYEMNSYLYQAIYSLDGEELLASPSVFSKLKKKHVTFQWFLNARGEFISDQEKEEFCRVAELFTESFNHLKSYDDGWTKRNFLIRSFTGLEEEINNMLSLFE